MQISTFLHILKYISTFPYISACISDILTPVKVVNKAVLLVRELELNGLPADMLHIVLITPQIVSSVHGRS